MPLFTCGPHVILNVFFSLETIPVGIINHMVTLILSHYYHWRHGDIKMWSRNRTVSHSHTKNERKKRREEKKRESKREYEWERKQAGREKENAMATAPAFWRHPLTPLLSVRSGFKVKLTPPQRRSSVSAVYLFRLIFCESVLWLYEDLERWGQPSLLTILWLLCQEECKFVSVI